MVCLHQLIFPLAICDIFLNMSDWDRLDNVILIMLVCACM